MGKKIYVGNLSYNVGDQELGEAFAQYGNVESARIVIDRESGRSKGFGFVEMSTDDEAREAIDKLNGAELAGRNMNVSEAKPMAPREGGGRGGFGGGRGGGGGRGCFGGGRGRN